LPNILSYAVTLYGIFEKHITRKFILV